VIDVVDSVTSGLVYATGPAYRKLNHDAIVERQSYDARAWFCDNGQWVEVDQSGTADSDGGNEPKP
jgi:hypothetical protein